MGFSMTAPKWMNDPRHPRWDQPITQKQCQYIWALEEQLGLRLTDLTEYTKRTASPDAFIYNEDKDQQVKKYRLLHGIRKLKLRYYRKDKEQWSNSWDTESEETRDKFPDIVELSIEVTAPRGLSFEGRYQIRPEVPLHGIPETL